MFYREKRIECGSQYIEIDIVPRSADQERYVKKGGRRRKTISRPSQMNLNDKNSKRYLIQLLNGNADNSWYMVTYSYKHKFLPASIEEAEKEIKNNLRRLKDRRKKLGLDELKYILITEYSESDDPDKSIRMHHHVVMNGGIDRNEIEDVWSKGRGKKRERIGLCNTMKLQFDENGVEGLTRYLLKDPKGKKRWSSSRNLKRPTIGEPNDNKYGRRQIEKYALSNDFGLEMFQKKYPNHFITGIRVYENEQTGYHFYLKLWRKNKVGNQPFIKGECKFEWTTENRWKDENLYRRDYGLFRGEELLAKGTVREIAEQRGVKVSTIFHYGTPGYQERTNGNGLRLDKI